MANAAKYIQRLISALRQTRSDVLRLRNLIENNVGVADRDGI